MKTIAGSALVVCGTVCMAASAAAQTPVGALAIDEGQGCQATVKTDPYVQLDIRVSLSVA